MKMYPEAFSLNFIIEIMRCVFLSLQNGRVAKLGRPFFA
uniref:Uncharacterized protein n=1 Tax=Arundo donax TaxID=35708 RepID=A0A0A9AAX4_ARUDO